MIDIGDKDFDSSDSTGDINFELEVQENNKNKIENLFEQKYRKK
jgi:hypothetical protein